MQREFWHITDARLFTELDQSWTNVGRTPFMDLEWSDHNDRRWSGCQELKRTENHLMKFLCGKIKRNLDMMLVMVAQKGECV